MDRLVQNALSYYDEHMQKYQKIFNKVDHSKTLTITNQFDLESDSIELFDKNGNKLLTANIEYIGKYINNLWIWSWSTMEYSTKNIRLSKKILDYGINLIIVQENGDDKIKHKNSMNLLLKTELTSSRVFISNKLYLDMHLAIAGYICKRPIIFGLTINEDVKYYNYYFLSNIRIEK